MMGHKGYYDNAYLSGGGELLTSYVEKAEKWLEPREAETIRKEEILGLAKRIEELEEDKMTDRESLELERKHRKELEERLRKAEERRLKMEKEIEKLREGDSDIDKIVEVLGTLINTPLRYTGPQDENWFDRAPMKKQKRYWKNWRREG